MTNIQQIMQMGQQLQARISQLQESLDQQTVTTSSGGGMVEVTADGKGEVKRIRIDPACVDPRDVEMLEDLVQAAVNQAQAKARELYEKEMRKATGNLPFPIPGL
ncbi:MAG: YbaB/EbfC family nucleoid-associated protein [Longimicrobiales bacterium]|nr:YbaB/EbfC family nucleoid-associated protein [Longimicrobiales bacterium]